MAFYNLPITWTLVNRVQAIILIVLTLLVSVPLSIETCREGGGPWGFGIIGLHILLPLTCYVLFAFSALLNNEKYQWRMFISAHLTSLVVGVIGFLLFPILPKILLLIPALLAVFSIVNKKRFPIYLSIMLALAVSANIVFLKWEFDFGRTIPFIELFHSTPAEP